MALLSYKCNGCSLSNRTIVYGTNYKGITCKKCGSDNLKIDLPKLKLDVNLNHEQLVEKIDRQVEDIYHKMGKEAVYQDTKTAENIFGTTKVEKTFYGNDD